MMNTMPMGLGYDSNSNWSRHSMLQSMMWTGLNTRGTSVFKFIIQYIILPDSVKTLLLSRWCMVTCGQMLVRTYGIDYSFLMFNTLRPRQNGRYFPDNISKRIFLNENCCILMKMSLKFVPQGSIKNIPCIGSDNGLAPVRRQAIIQTNDGLV